MCHRFSWSLRLLSLVLFLSATDFVEAHDPGLSSLALRLEKGRLSAILSLARADAESLASLDVNRDGKVTSEEFSAARPRLELVSESALEIQLDGKVILGGPAQVDYDPTDAVSFRFDFTEITRGRLLVRSTLLPNLPRGHRQYLTLRDERDQVLGDRMLDIKNDSFQIELSGSGSAASADSHPFTQFLLLGVEHIALGFDHLVFLLGLLVVGARFREVVKIISSFTVAHSITLALATLDLVRLSPRIVEPLIAASIIYVGVENMLRHDLRWRWVLAFVFGLVHGCGFASVLREAGLGANGASVAGPLLSFNLGVELGQVILAVAVLPIIWRLRRRPLFETKFVPAVSLLITLAGAFWLIERTLFGGR